MTNSDLEVARRLADVADAAILPHFRALAGVENKAATGFDPVTVADRAAEAAMREVLKRERPDDAVYGEEYADTPGTSGRVWILDPIDGTRGFMAGLPTWGVLIALVDGSGPVLGLMSQPFVGERFVGAEDAVHERAGRTTGLATRRCPALAEAVVATTSPDAFAGDDAAAFRRLSAATRTTRYGTDCYGYALLAAGHIDIVVETGLKTVDIAPFAAIVERAGGALVGRDGAPIAGTLPDRFAGTAVAVGDPALLPAVLAVLAFSS